MHAVMGAVGMGAIADQSDYGRLSENAPQPDGSRSSIIGPASSRVSRYGEERSATSVPVPVPAPRVTAPQPSAQSVAPLITPAPPFANEPKKVTTLAVRQDNSGADPAAVERVPAAAPAAGGAYVVQVSAQKTEDEARASYQALQQKYPSVLGSREANIRRADLGDKGVY